MLPKSPGKLLRTNPTIPALLCLKALRLLTLCLCASLLSLTVGGAATGAGEALMRVVATLAHAALRVSWVPAKGVTKAVAVDVTMARIAKAEKRAMIQPGVCLAVRVEVKSSWL